MIDSEFRATIRGFVTLLTLSLVVEDNGESQEPKGIWDSESEVRVRQEETQREYECK